MSKLIWARLFFSISVLAFSSGTLLADKLADPTRPLSWSGKAQAQSKLNLQAIYHRDGKVASAVLNGRVLSVGDAIQGWRVVDINKHRVLIKRNGVQKTLTLRQKLTKRD